MQNETIMKELSIQKLENETLNANNQMLIKRHEVEKEYFNVIFSIFLR